MNLAQNLKIINFSALMVYQKHCSLQQTEEFKDVPIVYIRFNPHFYKIDNRFFDMPLPQAHEKVWDIMQSITAEDIKPGMNLIYINYDQKDGKLCIFEDEEVNDYAEIFRNCVIKVA